MNTYTISRDVYKMADNGLRSKKVRREYLRVTKHGRYVWQDDLLRATELTLDESCTIMQHLQRVVRPQYTYHKTRHYQIIID